MNKEIKTAKAPPPFSNYAQGVATPTNARCLYVSGQVGITPSGDLPDDPAKQHEQAWKNIFAILTADGMDKTNIVDVLGIVTDHDQVPAYRIMRDKMLGEHRCASTLLICGLADPRWKVEIAVKAAKTG